MKMRLAFWLVNVGIRLMPYEYRNDIFLLNCMRTKKIKARLLIGRTEKEEPTKTHRKLVQFKDY